jgi:hypothetical protein
MPFLKDTLVFHLGQSVFSYPQVLEIDKFVVGTDRTADPFESRRGFAHLSCICGNLDNRSI